MATLRFRIAANHHAPQMMALVRRETNMESWLERGMNGRSRRSAPATGKTALCGASLRYAETAFTAALRENPRILVPHAGSTAPMMPRSAQDDREGKTALA